MRILFITICILILGLLDLLNPIRSVFQKFSSPIQFGLRKSAIETKDTFKLFYNINKIRKDNLELLDKNNELMSIIIDLKHADEENELLKNQLQLKGDKEYDKKLLIASVMGNPMDLSGTSIMIDKGERHGITLGSNVILGGNIVGIVREVTSERSKVELITSPNLSITVRKLGSSTEGLAVGDLGTSVKVTRLLPGEAVSKDDVFITSGKDGIFLPDLTVGVVEDFSFESAEPLKTAYLKTIIDLPNLYKVFIILEK
ncbi:hypothetical protein A2V49_02385 [candidate division WWE3 bacterium RBG_19FT_COMBO_34_6]|uniref:Cell shape-determining protein MreC n=1 Tax=candidate division WWE3 bacterium RBG_19FT_COMBO_34_6 TaxID=1802612 RepID=A0A1F4UN09_UNCKA|nr:MAG: hypothetical protein A2V49_02385 [candidate division WWE3 bacterium RBG_19FT_COMBO_34_6]